MPKKKIVPVAYKQAINRIERHKHNVETGKELHNEAIERFAIDIAPFITKKGTVRKNLSQKRVQEFNRIVTEFKKNKTNLYATQGEVKKKSLIKNAVKNGTYTEKEAPNIVNLFANTVIHDLVKNQHLDSEQIVQIGKDFANIKKTDIKKIAEYLKESKLKTTPQEVRDIVGEDDTIQGLQQFMLDLGYEFEESDIPF